ncbi:MAG: methyltransferase [Candidatus Cryptobacteroides sp.]
MEPKYKGVKISALEAQRAAHAIAFAPIVFQVSRLMVKYGIFRMLIEAGRKDPQGLTAQEIADRSGVSLYGVKVLLESSLTAGTVYYNDGRYTISKIGWFLENDAMVKADIDFNHYVNYKGMYHLDEAIEEGRPAGLRELGEWPTIYEGLSSLEPDVQAAWFGFDHFYSDNSFEQALPSVFASSPASILDIGGNTGRFALKCVEENDNVRVTVMDLPQQIGLLMDNIKNHPASGRISGHPGNLLDESTVIPGGFDVVWMSQFLDCFSEEQVLSILKRVSATLKTGARVFIMENLWDRQRFDTASFDLAQTSVYFTAMANGNSKLFFTPDLESLIGSSGLKIVSMQDSLGFGHTLIECVKA